MPPMNELASKAAQNAGDIVRLAIKHPPGRKALVVFDGRSPLSRLLRDAYRAALPDAPVIDFDASTPESVVAAVTALSPGDLAVLIQSSNFNLAAFRFRIEMFQRGLAVIEHTHLERAIDVEQMATYE